jgi:hypothetical protein
MTSDFLFSIGCQKELLRGIRQRKGFTHDLRMNGIFGDIGIRF